MQAAGEEEIIPHGTAHPQPADATSLSVASLQHASAGLGPSDVFDDIWEDPPPHGTGIQTHSNLADSASSSLTPDLHRLRTTHVTAGYRDGVASARESAVQGGFDEGYLLGAAIGIRAGYLQGVIEGLENGLDLNAVDAGARETLRSQLRDDRQELQLSNLMNEQWINSDGTWKWVVEPIDGEQEPTIGTVADAHPVLQRMNRVVSIYAHQLGVRRRENIQSPRSAYVYTEDTQAAQS